MASQHYALFFSSVVGLLLGNHARAGAMPSTLSTETAHAVAVGHRDDIVRAFTLEQLYRWKGLRAGKF